MLPGIVDQIRSGDQGAVGVLYDQVRLCSDAAFHSLDHNVIEDQTQDIMMIAMDAVLGRRLVSANALTGFVRSIARRRFIGLIRDPRRWRMSSLEARMAKRHPGRNDDFWEPADAADSPEESLIKREWCWRLRRSLALLGIRDREILSRFYYAEEPAEQICREMSITERAFQCAKSRALQKCAEHMMAAPLFCSRGFRLFRANDSALAHAKPPRAAVA